MMKAGKTTPRREPLPVIMLALAVSALACATFIVTTRAQTPSGTAAANGPQFTNDGMLMRPEHYREWIYLSSGLGMSYSKDSGAPPLFTNVFVAPAAYRAFLASGKWPDHAMFVLEERAASSQGSINKTGHFQTGLEGLAASVKDEKRFGEKWAYFSFSEGEAAAAPNSKTMCWQCHNDHGAVDNTFVQFYPTLKKVALKLETYDKEKAGSEPSGEK
jgi:hypothetical protein